MSLRFLFLGFLAFQFISAGFSEAKDKDLLAANPPTIRKITVFIVDVFEDPSKGGFYSSANSLKINTREKIIRRELLFKEGDQFNAFQIEESERVLRTLRYLRNISIIPKIDGNFVDVDVYAQDSWTLIPYLNFSAGSGSTDQLAFGVTDSNILGYGKRAELLYRDQDGRESIEAVWDDQRVLGSKNNLLLAYFDRSDGYEYLTNAGKPYRSLKDVHAWNLSGRTLDNIARLYSAGDERYIFGQEKLDLGAWYSFAEGNPNELIERFTFGYDYFDYSFREATAQDYDDADVDPSEVTNDPALLPLDRRFSYPFLAYSRIVPDFVSHAYVDRFDRVQDFNLGNVFDAKLGYAAKAFGSSRDAAILSLNDSDGFRISERSFVRGELGAAGRYESGDIENGLLRAELKHVYLLGPKYLGSQFIGNHTIVTSSALNYGYNLDGEREFYMGASEGLRGYDSRTFYGDKSFVIGAEDRFHLYENLLELISLGGAFFVEAGGATDGSLKNLFENEIYGDFGVGLRVGFPRSSGGRVLRLDVAVPFRDGPDGTNGFEIRLSIQGGQVLDAILSSERYKAYNVNVDSGFED